jgi:hypothetical protein
MKTRMSQGDPEGEPTMEEASQSLSHVLAQVAKEAAELAEKGAENYSNPLAYHLLAMVDCWYQGKGAFSDGHYEHAVQLAEATQMLLNDIPWMKQTFPVPLASDQIWGTDAEEGSVT